MFGSNYWSAVGSSTPSRRVREAWNVLSDHKHRGAAIAIFASMIFYATAFWVTLEWFIGTDVNAATKSVKIASLLVILIVGVELGFDKNASSLTKRCVLATLAVTAIVFMFACMSLVGKQGLIEHAKTIRVESVSRWVAWIFKNIDLISLTPIYLYGLVNAIIFLFEKDARQAAIAAKYLVRVDLPCVMPITLVILFASFGAKASTVGAIASSGLSDTFMTGAVAMLIITSNILVQIVSTEH